MKVTLDSKRKVMTIEIPYTDKPEASSTGKTLMVATSRGNKETDATVDGKPIYIGLNAYIYAGER